MLVDPNASHIEQPPSPSSFALARFNLYPVIRSQ